MADKMQAMVIEQPGAGGRLVMHELPRSTCGDHEVLITVAYSAVNRADLFQVAGKYPAPEETAMVPGLEVSGTVAAVGSAVRDFRVGDPVCALLKGGGYAEYVAVPAGLVLPLPRGIGLRDAAALPEALATVWTAVFRRGALAAGETLVIEGGASSIGLAAIQLARLSGAQVIASARGAEKQAFCESLGAMAVESDPTAIAARVKELTGGKGADVVLDMLGGEYATANVEMLRYGGRIVTIALMAGRQGRPDLGRLLMKNLTWHGLTLRSQPEAEKASVLAELRQRVWPWVEEGSYRPIIDRAYPLNEANEAHKSLRERLHLGKILLEVTNPPYFDTERDFR